MKHSILTLTTAALIAALPAAFAQGVSSDAPGRKTKDSSIPFLPAWLNEPIGRTAFGAGAVLIWVFLIVMAVVGARSLRGPKQ